MAARRVIVGLAGTLALSFAGCGASSFPSAAEPAVSPPLRARPAGATFEVGAEPEGVVADPRSGLVAVITRDPDRLALVDLRQRRVVRRAPLPSKGRHLALERRGGPVLVPAEDANRLVEVAIPSGHERRLDVGEHPHDAVSADGKVFVGNEFGNSVSVVKGKRVVATLGAPVQPGGIAAGAGFVAVVAVAERVLATYDAGSLQRLGQVDAGAGPTHVVALGRRAWVADTEGNAILTFRLGRRPRLLSSLAAPGTPYGMALDSKRDILWVTLTARNELVGYDVSGSRPQEVARYPTLRQPNTVAVDSPRRELVLAGVDSGKLEEIREAGP